MEAQSPRPVVLQRRGHVDSGETYEEAGHREMREEIGADCSLVKFWKVGATEETGFEFVEYLVGLSDGPFRFAPGEVETGALFPVEQIRRWVERSPGEFTRSSRSRRQGFWVRRRDS